MVLGRVWWEEIKEVRRKIQLVFTVFNENAFMGFLEIVSLFFCFAKIKKIKKVECILGHAVVIETSLLLVFYN